MILIDIVILTRYLNFPRDSILSLEGNLEPTLPFVIPVVNVLVEKMQARTRDSLHMRKLKSILRNRIEKHVRITDFHKLSTFVHPSLKKSIIDTLTIFEKQDFVGFVEENMLPGESGTLRDR